MKGGCGSQGQIGHKREWLAAIDKAGERGLGGGKRLKHVMKWGKLNGGGKRGTRGGVEGQRLLIHQWRVSLDQARSAQALASGVIRQ